MTEDLSLWKYKRICRSCKKEFGSDDPRPKQRCWICTYGWKAQLVPKLAPKPRRKPPVKLKPISKDKYDDIHFHLKKHGWTWS